MRMEPCEWISCPEVQRLFCCDPMESHMSVLKHSDRMGARQTLLFPWEAGRSQTVRGPRHIQTQQVEFHQLIRLDRNPPV